MYGSRHSQPSCLFVSSGSRRRLLRTSVSIVFAGCLPREAVSRSDAFAAELIDDTNPIASQRSLMGRQLVFRIIDIDLQIFGGEAKSARALGINAAGEVLCSVLDAKKKERGFVVTTGQATDLGSFGSNTSPSAINNVGQVVGLAASFVQSEAFIWDKQNKLRFISSNNGSASAINDAGQMVGMGDRVPGTRQGFCWPTDHATNREVIQLIDLADGYQTFPNGINNAGLIVGAAYTGGGIQGDETHAVIWTLDGSRSLLPSKDLDTLGGQKSVANAINGAGKIVGGAETNESMEHACLWDGESKTDLGVLLGGELSTALSINNANQVVGVSTTAPGQKLYGPGTRAFYWDVNQPMIELDILQGGDFSGANSINDSGEIVGWSSTSPGIGLFDPGIHACRWTAS